MDFVYCEILSTLSSANFPRLFVQRRECRRSVWNLLEAVKQLFSSSTIDTRERRKWLSCMWQEWAASCNGSCTMTHLIIAEHYLFIFAINATGFYFPSLSLFAISSRLSSVFSPRVESSSLATAPQKCMFVVFWKLFFFLSAVSRPRQIEVSRWRLSSKYKEEVSLVLRAVYLQSRLEILYAKLSTSIGSFSKLEFEKLHCTT